MALLDEMDQEKTMLMKHIFGFRFRPHPDQLQLTVNYLEKILMRQIILEPLLKIQDFFPGYSGFRNLKMLASIRHKISDEDIKNAIRLVGLDPESKKHVGKIFTRYASAPWTSAGTNGAPRYSSFG